MSKTRFFTIMLLLMGLWASTARDPSLVTAQPNAPSSGIKGFWLGITVQDLTPELTKAFGLKELKGVVIISVKEGGPAHEAGIKEGDTIIAVDRIPITGSEVFLKVMRSKAAGKKLTLTVHRNGQQLLKTVTLAEAPSGLQVDQQRHGQHFRTQRPPLNDSLSRPYGEWDKRALDQEQIIRHLNETPSHKPTIRIEDVVIKPATVSAGSPFDLEIQYTVTDPDVQKEKIPIRFSYKITGSNKVLFESDPIEVKSHNGTKMPRVVHLKATKEKGAYEIEASIQYKNETVGEIVEFEVE